MIRKLKIRFIILALSALFMLLAFIIGGINLLNYNAIIREADAVLSLLSQNHGTFPEFNGGRGGPIPPGMSPELPFESRFFSVLADNKGNIIRAETGKISAIDGNTASEYAKDVIKKGKKKGFEGKYRFAASTEGSALRIIFLDRGRQFDTFHNFAVFSIGMSLLGYLIIAILVCFFAGRLTRPVAESYEKQKRFITDAGHEIKTPLTIIGANVDVLKMDMGENECLNDIEAQTKRLASLTNDLVYLARMEEGKNETQPIEFPVSDVIQDTAEAFRTPAEKQNKELVLQTEPLLSMRGNEKAISQLVSILLDNALKYSPEGSSIALTFEKQGRKLVLTVRNTSVSPLDDENLRRIFDRFYRTDPSRNSETGGHGIGLSIAQAIVSSHEGKISAASPDGTEFIITASFPARL